MTNNASHRGRRCSLTIRVNGRSFLWRPRLGRMGWRLARRPWLGIRWSPARRCRARPSLDGRRRRVRLDRVPLRRRAVEMNASPPCSGHGGLTPGLEEREVMKRSKRAQRGTVADAQESCSTDAPSNGNAIPCPPAVRIAPGTTTTEPSVACGRDLGARPSSPTSPNDGPGALVAPRPALPVGAGYWWSGRPTSRGYGGPPAAHAAVSRR